MYICGIIAAITLKSLPKKSLSRLAESVKLSDIQGIMYNSSVVLGDMGLSRGEIQGIGAAIQTTQQVILVTTTNLRRINDNVKCFRHNL